LTTLSVVAIGSVFMIKFKKQSLAVFAPSGTLADEAISSIRNAMAFNTQEKLATQYDAYLAKAGRVDFKVRSVVIATIAFIIGASQLNYVSILVCKEILPSNLILWQALAFWQGSRYLVTGDMTLPQLLTILLAVIAGTFALTTMGPNIQVSFSPPLSDDPRCF
jgi:ATP-binding cassette, subfamily B (MDR/TAP), member 1